MAKTPTTLQTKLTPPESFGPISSVAEGIAALSKLSYETMIAMRDSPAMPPALVMDLYKIACLARAVDESTGATKSLGEAKASSMP